MWLLQVDVGHVDLETEENKVEDIVRLIKTTGKLRVDEGKYHVQSAIKLYIDF